jgi:hypothetical protein
MEQYKRQKRLVGEVDFCITDSPLLLGIVYATPPHRGHDGFESMVWRLFREFNNTNITLRRDKPYVEYGRTQTEDEAVKLDVDIEALCVSAGRTALLPADRDAPKRIMKGLGLGSAI